MPNPENIVKHKFKKGQSGNPKGRPKLPDIKDVLAQYLADQKDGVNALEAMILRLRQMAIGGDLKAMEMLMDRAYGKPKQAVDHTTGGEPMPCPVIVFPKDEQV
jgi:hypothetical protein